jgi:hypothetical protein
LISIRQSSAFNESKSGTSGALERLPDCHVAPILRGEKQLGSCLVQGWMDELGSKLDQGNEHEAAFGQARMWNFDSGFVNHFCIVEKNIEVDDPGTARDSLAAAKFAFDPLKRLEQLPRRERSFPFDYAIQKPGLREKIDGLRLINRRAAQNGHANSWQGFNGAFQIRGPLAKVGPEGKIDEVTFSHTEV